MPPRKRADMQPRRQAGGHAASYAHDHPQDGLGFAEQAPGGKPDPAAWPALGASSKEGDRDSGAQSNREGWPGRVREGGTRFLIRRNKRRTGDAVGGGPCPRRDRTQISEAPQAVESLHKCALRGADFCLVLRSAPELNELRSFSDWGLPEEALLA